MLHPIFSRSFEKDLKRASKRWWDTAHLRTVMERLVYEIPLELRNRNHRLSGNWIGRYECHIEPDWILIYKLAEGNIIFERTGTHSDLFE